MRVLVLPLQADTSHTQWLPPSEAEAATDVTRYAQSSLTTVCAPATTRYSNLTLDLTPILNFHISLFTITYSHNMSGTLTRANT
jgi:hypothetical protein